MVSSEYETLKIEYDALKAERDELQTVSRLQHDALTRRLDENSKIYAELEKLRAERDELEKSLKRLGESHMLLNVECNQLAAKNKELIRQGNENEHNTAERDKLQAECERLRSLIADAIDGHDVRKLLEGKDE